MLLFLSIVVVDSHKGQGIYPIQARRSHGAAVGRDTPNGLASHPRQCVVVVVGFGSPAHCHGVCDGGQCLGTSSTRGPGQTLGVAQSRGAGTDGGWAGT